MSELPRSEGPTSGPATTPTTGSIPTRPLPGSTPPAKPGDARPGTGKPADTKPKTTPPAPLRTPTGTRASYTWLALTAAAIAMVLLIIFILQNTQTVTVTFLMFEGSLPLAVALLIAGVATLILTLAVGAARILQLRRFSKRAAKRSNKLAASPKSGHAKS